MAQLPARIVRHNIVPPFRRYRSASRLTVTGVRGRALMSSMVTINMLFRLPLSTMVR
jgi:hypothetical protein